MKSAFSSVRGRLATLGAAALMPVAIVAPANAQCSPAPQWSLATPDAPQILPRGGSAIASETSRNQVVLFGGTGFFPYGEQGDTWVYDGTSWTQAATTGPSPRVDHRMSYDPQRQRTVLVGGASSFVGLDDTWEWNGSAWSQVPVTLGPGIRGGFALSYGGAGRTVYFGGFAFVDGVPTVFNDTWIFDGTTWSPVAAASSPPGLENASLVYDPVRQRVVLYGGQDVDFNPSDETWELDLDAPIPAWTQVAVTGPGARTGATMVYDAANARVLLAGGVQSGGDAGDTWAYDGASWTLVTSQNPELAGPAGRSGIAYFQPATGAGRPIIATWGPTATFRLTGSSWTLIDTPRIPNLRDYALTYDPGTGRVLLFGGSNLLNAPVGATWSYDGSAWTLRSTLGPPGREMGALAFQTTPGLAVLFGGRDADGLLGDTWTFDGTSWTQLIIPGPSPRYGHAMAFDPSRNLVVLYGGEGEDGALADTWTFNGTAWTLVSAASAPGPRGRTVAAYDPSRQQVVLVGGRDADFAGISDAWGFNGTSWTLLTSGGFSPRHSAALAFDAGANRLTLFGGQNNDGIAENDTWTLAGAAWTRLDAAGPTPAFPPDSAGRSNLKAVYDAGRARITIYGGFDGGTSRADTWTFTQGQTLPATITAHPPASRSTSVGNTVTFSAAAFSTRPAISYRWRFNGADLADGPTPSGAVISGASTPTLTLSPAKFESAGTYDLRVTTDCGSVFSGSSRLAVLFCPGDFDLSGSRTIDDIFIFLNAWFAGCTGQGGPPCNGLSTDVDFSGDRTIDDIFIFLNIWFAGCP